MPEQTRKPRGFQTLTPERRREIASMGGRAAHEAGTGHRFTTEEARKAGRKGGLIIVADRDHMAEIGERGGLAVHQRKRERGEPAFPARERVVETTQEISRDASDDPIHAALKAAVEVPTSTYLWVPEDAVEFTPLLCNTVFGDGRALLAIAPMNTRPMYYAVRIDSGWKVDDFMSPEDAPDLRDFIDHIYDALAAQFGDAGPHEDDDGNEYFDEWPAFDASAGTSWGRLNWPDGVGSTESHPFARFRKILKTEQLGDVLDG